MTLRPTQHPLLSILLAAAFMLGCASDPSGPDGGDGGETLSVSGLWDYVLNVTVANGICTGEEFEDNDNPESGTALFVQNGTNVTATALWSASDGLPHDLVGSIDGDTVTVTGSYPEDLGTTTRTLILGVNAGRTSMAGFEEWTWTDGADTCPDGVAIVTATKQ